MSPQPDRSCSCRVDSSSIPAEVCVTRRPAGGDRRLSLHFQEFEPCVERAVGCAPHLVGHAPERSLAHAARVTAPGSTGGDRVSHRARTARRASGPRRDTAAGPAVVAAQLRPGHEVCVYSPQLAPIDWDDVSCSELVGLSTTTSTALAAYEMADHYAHKGFRW